MLIFCRNSGKILNKFIFIQLKKYGSNFRDNLGLILSTCMVSCISLNFTSNIKNSEPILTQLWKKVVRTSNRLKKFWESFWITLRKNLKRILSNGCSIQFYVGHKVCKFIRSIKNFAKILRQFWKKLIKPRIFWRNPGKILKVFIFIYLKKYGLNLRDNFCLMLSWPHCAQNFIEFYL